MTGTWEWRKSSYSGGTQNNCVEVAVRNDETRIRDTKDRAGGHLSLTAAGLQGLIRALAEN
jgi:hypothetical protein